jgi:hypothetical protein
MGHNLLLSRILDLATVPPGNLSAGNCQLAIKIDKSLKKPG